MPRLNAKGLIVDYEETGFGIPLIFIHGVMESRHAFHYQLLGLRTDYKVISYDLRHGLKNPIDYTLDLLVNDLRCFLDAMDLPSVVLCGHTLGALIAADFAIKYPERTSAFVPISAFAAPLHDVSDHALMSMVEAGYHKNRPINARIKMQITRLIRGATEDILKYTHEDTVLRYLAQKARKVNQATITQRLRILRKANMQDLIPQISVPTLIFVGADDIPIVLSSAQYMYEHMADATLEVIEGAGRFCFVTHHDEFNAAIDEFVKERLIQIS